MTKKTPTKRITQSRFAQFFEKVWYILGVAWRILVYRGFKIGMAKGGLLGRVLACRSRPSSQDFLDNIAVLQKTNTFLFIVIEV